MLFARVTGSRAWRTATAASDENLRGLFAVPAAEYLALDTWYNHVRPHDSLDGLTPAEVWSGSVPTRREKPLYFETWKGVLTGFYFPD